MVGDIEKVTLELIYVNKYMSSCAIVMYPWWFTKKDVISTRFVSKRTIE